MEKQEVNKLKVLSANIRMDILKMLKHTGYGHLGGSLSIVEVMSVLYGKHLCYDPKNPAWDKRDMVVLSKGHCGPGWYAALANANFFSKEMLYTLNEGGTNLPSHPDRTKTPGIDMTTGSLGQGVSVAAGLATGMKLKNEDRYVYVILGDGELNEGQCWEAFQYLANYKLNNCIVFIDENKKQLDGSTVDTMNPFDLVKKMEAFGFYTQRVDGSKEEDISNAIDKAKKVKNLAVCIILDTIKGQGVNYFEKMAKNHSVKFNNEEINSACELAIKELERFVKGGEENVYTCKK